MEESPVGDGKRNGVIEIAVKSIEGQVRFTRRVLEYRIRATLLPDHPISMDDLFSPDPEPRCEVPRSDCKGHSRMPEKQKKHHRKQALAEWAKEVA